MSLKYAGVLNPNRGKYRVTIGVGHFYIIVRFILYSIEIFSYICNILLILGSFNN